MRLKFVISLTKVFSTRGSGCLTTSGNIFITVIMCLVASSGQRGKVARKDPEMHMVDPAATDCRESLV